MNSLCLRWGVFFVLSLILLNPLFASESPSVNCDDAFKTNSFCPKETCALNIKCHGGDCQFVCEPSPCMGIDAQHCPRDRCQLLEGCEDKKKVCYDKADNPPSCGDIGYAGESKCCQGLVKRCGVEFFDKTCDMVGKNSIYSIPICIPCGNGTCNQFEDQCNCPEDCRRD